jgi:hypothetical protein
MAAIVMASAAGTANRDGRENGDATSFKCNSRLLQPGARSGVHNPAAGSGHRPGCTPILLTLSQQRECRSDRSAEVLTLEPDLIKMFFKLTKMSFRSSA